MTTQEKVVLAITSMLGVAMIGGLAFAFLFARTKTTQQLGVDLELPQSVQNPVLKKQSIAPEAPLEHTVIRNAERPEMQLVVAACPEIMNDEQFAQCLRDAKNRLAAMNRDLAKYGGPEVNGDPVRGDRCVTIFGVGAGPMEFYPNGYGLWIEKDRRFVFFPKGADGIQLIIDASDEDYVFISTGESNSLTLQMFRSDDGTFDRIGDWEKVENADDIFDTAMYYHSKE